MIWEAWVTLAVVVIVVVLLTRDFTSPAAVVFGAVVVLLVANVLDADSAFRGFANSAPITVAALYVVAAGIERTGILEPLVTLVLGSAGGRRSLVRLLGPAAGASAFLNNTPIVAMLVPPVSRWAQRLGVPASRLLMPLSFAAVLGGTITVIGTSTNIVISGLLEASGAEPLGFFEVAKLGVPATVVGLALLVLLAPVLLPERRAARRDMEDAREFVVEMTVAPGSVFDGTSVEQAGLRRLAGVFLAQVERGGEMLAPVSPQTLLEGGDVLRFVGNAADVADLHNRSGLVAAAKEHARRFPSGRLAFFEAVIGSSSSLVGGSLRSVGFRDRYQGAVLAIHRADRRVDGKLGDVRLRTGDTLLVIAAPLFRTRWHGTGDFLLVSRFGRAEPARTQKALQATLIGGAVVLSAAFGVLSILEASLLGAIAVVALGVLTPSEARAAVDLNVVVVIASSFGLAAAIQQTGLAQRLADGLVNGLEGFGGTVVLIGVALTTIALTEIVTNNAAAILIFPIAVATAEAVGADPRAFALTVAFAASASFLTPIGYQTNTMVWGPGGYRFTDYARLGAALTLSAIIVVAVVAPMWWSL